MVAPSSGSSKQSASVNPKANLKNKRPNSPEPEQAKKRAKTEGSTFYDALPFILHKHPEIMTERIQQYLSPPTHENSGFENAIILDQFCKQGTSEGLDPRPLGLPSGQSVISETIRKKRPWLFTKMTQDVDFSKTEFEEVGEGAIRSSILNDDIEAKNKLVAQKAKIKPEHYGYAALAGRPDFLKDLIDQKVEGGNPNTPFEDYLFKELESKALANSVRVEQIRQNPSKDFNFTQWVAHNVRNPETLIHNGASTPLINVSGGVNINRSFGNTVNNSNYAPVHWPAAYGNQEMLALLKDVGADLSQANNDGDTPAHFAARNGHDNIIEALHAAGVDINKANNDGNTPAHLAARYGHVNIIKALKAAGVDCNKTNKSGWTPAHTAAFEGNAAVISVLKDAGVDLNKTNITGYTPTNLAVATGGKIAVLKALIKAKADINKPDNSGQTPVHTAVQSNDTSILITLIEGQADLNKKDSAGNTPADLAARQNKQGVLNLLQRYGAQFNTFKPNKN